MSSEIQTIQPYRVQAKSILFSALLILCMGAVSSMQAQWSSSGGNTTTNDKVGIGTTSPQAPLDITGRTTKLSNFEPTYRLDYGGGADLAWKTLANVTLGTGLYVGANFEVRILDAQNNWGISTDARLLRYYVYMARSGGTQDDANTAQVSGPIADYVRVVKTSAGQYELQIRQIQNWQRLKFEVTAYAINSLGSGGAVSYVDNLTSGSSAGTIYEPAPVHREYFPNLFVNGNVGIGTTSPQFKFEVNGSGQTTANLTDAGARGNSLALVSDSGNAGSGGALLFGNVQSNNANSIGWAAIKGVLTNGSGNTAGDLAFSTRTSTGDSALSEKMRLLSNGKLGIGTTSPNGGSTLDVRGGVSVNQTQSSTQRGAGLDVGWTGSDHADIYFGDYTNGWALGENPDASMRIFKTSGASLSSTPVTIQAGGNVGIGTTSPGSPLTVSSGQAQQIRMVDSSSNSPYLAGYSAASGGTRYGFIQFASGGSTVSASTGPLQFYAGNESAERMRIDSSGNVGIGTSDPGGYKLNVNGNTNVTGNINLTGSINAKYQDVAEWVPSSEQLSAGTVVVLDSTKSNQVTSSSTSYDTRVAGVVSEQPGIALGEKSEGKVLVATTGRVRVKVDASKSPIHIGDLLVTSDLPGVAMKSEAVNLGGVQIHRPGTLIGKALEPLEKGKGEILVLLSLQ
jgi:hypothetical protein